MKSCDGCNEKTSIPYVVHEATVTRLERINERLWVVILILIFALIASNLAWVIYEKQFDVVEKNVEAEEFDMPEWQIKTIVYKAQNKLFAHT